MVKNKTILIWDIDSGEIPECDRLVLWQNYKVNKENNEISIPQLVENNADKLKSQYLALIYELGEAEVNGKRIVDHLEIRPGFSYWWMTLLTEKCNFSKSPQIDNIIKLMAFYDWLKNKDYRVIKLVSKNSALADSMRILTVKLNITFDWEQIVSEKSKDSLVRRIYNNFPNILKAIISLAHHLIDRWKLRGVGVAKWKNSSATISFVSYLFHLDLSAANASRYKSGYWSELLKVLDRNNIQSNWLHFYIKSMSTPTVSTAKQLLNRFNSRYKEKQNHVFLESFLSFKVVRKTLESWLKVVVQYGTVKGEIEKQTGFLWPLFVNDVKVSLLGVTAIQNLLSYYLFIEAMDLLPVQRKGVYLQENQGWEFGFISAWKQFSHSGLIGMPHSTVRYWDLRYFFDQRSYERSNSCNIPLPDKVATNGEVAKNNYTNGGYPESDLVKVEALRYLYLDTIASHKNNSSVLKKREKVLVLGDYLQENTVKQMQLLQEASQYIENRIQYIVKPHPACPILREDYPELDMTVTHKSIHKLIDSCLIAYTSAVTSAAVDAYCAGKLVVTVLDPNALNLSPLRGVVDGVSFVRTSNELAEILNNIDTIKDSTSKRREDYFYLDNQLPKWKKLLINNENVSKERIA